MKDQDRQATLLALREQAEEDGDDGELRRLLLQTAGRCIDCQARLRAKDECPDKPGHYFVVCAWCREHRGQTHCDECSGPLGTGETEWCAACAAELFEEVEPEVAEGEGRQLVATESTADGPSTPLCS